MPIIRDASIRDSGAADAPMLSGLIREAFADVAVRFGLTPENCPRHPSNCAPEWVSSAMAKDARYFVVEADGEAAGCVAVEPAGPEVGYLERLAVLPAWRGRGLGTALVEHACHEAARLGVRRVQIGVIAKDKRLTQWYEARGFRALRTATFAHLPFEVLFMEAALAASGERTP